MKWLCSEFFTVRFDITTGYKLIKNALFSPQKKKSTIKEEKSIFTC